MQDNGGDNLPVSASGTFAFPTKVASGAAYAVTVMTQPTAPSQTCTPTGGSGTVAGAAVNVTIACVTNQYTINATVSGLSGSGLVLQDNAGDNLPVSANGTFAFATKVASGAAYAVTVLTPPSTPSQTCTPTSGSGTVGATNITVVIACVTNQFTISASVSGLSGSGLVLQNNGGNSLPIAGNGVTPFTVKIASGNPYAVSVFAQPTNPSQTCTPSSGSGTVAGAPITVVVACTTNKYTVGGTIVGYYAGSGLILKDTTNNHQVTVSPGGTFTITPAINSGTSYAISVLTQPSNPTKNCAVTGGTGSGSVTNANVSSVTVNCAGTYVFVTNGFDGLTGSIAAFLITPGSGALTMIGGVPVVTSDQPSEIALDPSGTYAYVTSYGSADIDTYSIAAGVVSTPATATAALVAGDEPYSVVVDPAGANLYVGYSTPSADSFVGAYSLSGGVLKALPATTHYRETPHLESRLRAITSYTNPISTIRSAAEC